jgi:hypothetical protein
MKNAHVVVLSLCFAAFAACGPNVISSGMDSGNPDMDAGNNMPDAGNAYPAGPYGVSVNRTIQNFALPGYFTAIAGVKVNGLTLNPNNDLQSMRNAMNQNGQPFRFLLLDISAGWCGPCNQEAQDLGMSGADKTKVADWFNRGGIFVTVLEEGYNETSEAAPVEMNIETWINDHNVQSSVLYDPNQSLIAQGISPSAFPTNLVIDLRTMKIVAAWYGLDTTYQKWEAALNGP